MSVIGAGSMIRLAREAQGLTQAELGRRMGISQPAVARIEAAGNNVTVETLQRATQALGRVLEVRVTEPQRNVDETLVATMLRLTPERRLDTFESFYAGAREIAMAGARARGMA